MGLSPLSWPEIHAWMEVTGNAPGYCELELIRTIDRAFLKVHAVLEEK